MKKVALALLVVCVAVMLSGCWGPQKLTRGLDDWTNKTNVESPWLSQPLSWIVYPIGFGVTNIVDGLILNPIAFWGEDAWDGEGTPYIHENPGK